jgi:DNA polymerase-1
MERFGIRTIDAKGYEADDCIATLAKRFEEESEIVILTGDMDTLQLVNKTVTVRAFKSGIKETITYDEQGVEERIGVPPKAAVFWKALVGDQSDNIPGVRGIGPKTAADLLKEYETLEGIYAHLEEIPEKTREKLIAGKEAAFFAESLVRLDATAPIPPEPLAHYEVKRNDDTIRAYAESLGFMRLVARMSEEPPAPKEPKKTREKQGDHAGQTRMF